MIHFRRWIIATLTLAMTLASHMLLAAEGAPYSAKDALCDDHPGCRGIAPLQKWVNAQWHIFKTFKLTPAAKDVVRFSSDTFQALSLENFMTAPFAHVMQDKTRVFSFTGAATTEHYLISYRKGPIRDYAPQNFMDGGLQFGILHNLATKDQYGAGYRLSWEGFLQTDELNHKTQLALAARQLKVLDPLNISKLKTQKTDLFQNNSGLARSIIDDTVATLPGFSELLDSYTKISIIADPKVSDNRQFLRFSLRAKLNVESIRESYPNLGNYLARMMQFLQMKSDSALYSRDGLKILETTYNSELHEIFISFNTASGAIIPENTEGQPVFHKGLNPAQMKTFDGYLTNSLFINVYGLRIQSDNTRISVSYRDGQIAKFSWRITKMPIPEFRGALFGVMPPGFLDIMMPGNLKEYSRMLAYGLVKGNGGQGTFGNLMVDSRRPQKTTIQSSAGTELKDNFYLNIGLRVINDYLWPSAETVEDFRQFMAEGTEALRKDLIDLPTRREN